MENNFDKWNEVKKRINIRNEPYFHEGEIWWIVSGINIGVEMNGKGDEYLRPSIILKKYNQFGCLIIPLSSARIANKDNISLGMIQNKEATANLSQIRSISSKRLIEKIQIISKEELLKIQKTVMEYNFLSQSFEILSPEIGEQPEGQHTNI
ncbi:MAG TPA: type II toxin-antitoxin system PemK/MazF family toxin [Candidatus Paceibacterota bacterium]